MCVMIQSCMFIVLHVYYSVCILYGLKFWVIKDLTNCLEYQLEIVPCSFQVVDICYHVCFVFTWQVRVPSYQ